ncbi:B12-binding domain-containing radical SAM protein [Kitasatospora sp. NPDC059088]|uniref:B12-binding domain-containing radical SAM protein n=1 Tax=Kitasatospora sp. NPDC059088 TaxID=3346722 RepID=UPI0036BF16AF
MSELATEIDAIRRREIHLTGPYPAPDPDGLRVVLLSPYGHAYSLLATGMQALYEKINRDARVPAHAERAHVYDCLTRDGNRLSTPDGEPLRTIENPAPVADADLLGIGVTNAGALHTVLGLLDLAGIPRRCADRSQGRHPLLIGGSGGLANPEPLADYLDIVALGDAEESLAALIRLLHGHRGAPREQVLTKAAQIPGLYVPQLYEADLLPGGGLTRIRPRTPAAPASVRAQHLPVHALGRAHFASTISDGTCSVLVPTFGCKHSCRFCTLGTPDFRQAPLATLIEAVDTLEERGIRQIIISSPTFTQFRHRGKLLDRIRQYADRSPEPVTTIIGSVRADEVSGDYLDQVASLGDFGHLFTELNLAPSRGILTIAPESAAPDLVRILGKTMDAARVNRAIDLCHERPEFTTVMLYFIVGIPGETQADRLAIADYALDIHQRLGRTDGQVIVKVQQFMPKPTTPSQRLEMADPDLVEGWNDAIRERLRSLAGTELYERSFRVQWGETSRLLLEAVCLRGDRRVGHVLEDLHDADVDLSRITRPQLSAALAAHGLDFSQHLRDMAGEVLPWDIVNTVDPAAEQDLAERLTERAATR